MFTPLSSPTLRSNRPGSRRTHLARVVAWATATVVTVAGGAAAAAVATQSAGPGGPDAPAAGAGASTTPQRVDCAVAKCVALTFDDGPGPYTGRLLSDLKAANAKATFFVLGKQAQGNPGMIRRLHEAGMVVGSHGWDHKAFSKLTAAQQRAQLDRTARAIQDAGAPRPTLFRPPYGAANSATKKLGVPLILWNVDTLDWKSRNLAKATTAALKQSRRGSIILMHDIHPTSVAAVPGLIRLLRARGYTLVTVPELLGPTKPGGRYFGRH